MNLYHITLKVHVLVSVLARDFIFTEHHMCYFLNRNGHPVALITASDIKEISHFVGTNELIDFVGGDYE